MAKVHDLKASLGTKVLVWIIFKEIDDDFYNKDFYEVLTIPQRTHLKLTLRSLARLLGRI